MSKFPYLKINKNKFQSYAQRTQNYQNINSCLSIDMDPMFKSFEIWLNESQGFVGARRCHLLETVLFLNYGLSKMIFLENGLAIRLEFSLLLLYHSAEKSRIMVSGGRCHFQESPEIKKSKLVRLQSIRIGINQCPVKQNYVISTWKTLFYICSIKVDQ